MSSRVWEERTRGIVLEETEGGGGGGGGIGYYGKQVHGFKFVLLKCADFGWQRDLFKVV